MVCKNCGKENKDDTKFCTQCGSKFEEINVDKNSEIDGNSVDNTLDKEKSVDNSEETIEYVNNVNYSNSVNNQNGDNFSTTNKKNTGLIVVLVIALVIAIVGVSAVILWKVNSNKVSGNDVNSNNYIDTKTSNNNLKDIDTTTNNNNKINNLNNNNDEGKNISTKFDNYNIDVDVTMEVSGMAVKAKFAGTVDEKNQIEYLKMTMEMFGINVSSETYTDLKNGVTYMSEPITGSWIKEKGASQMVDLNSLLDSLKSMKNVDIIDNNHFKVKITNDDIKGMLDATDADIDDITGDIFAEIFTNNGYIEEIKYDFSNISEEFGDFSMNMKLSNYNKAGDIIIPNEVIESATEK